MQNARVERPRISADERNRARELCERRAVCGVPAGEGVLLADDTQPDRASRHACLRDLGVDHTVAVLVESEGDRVIRLEVDDPGAVTDLDTPEDYRRLVGGTGPAV